jgi:O-acetyl-ADP-ribose deacetylase (regulator of RNase III)
MVLNSRKVGVVVVHYLTGNLFESVAQAIVNTVNCEGYMGKGIAYQFKLLYPKNYLAYVKACKSGDLQIGKVFPYEENGKIILNFPTKDTWRKNSKIEYIESGLKSLAELTTKFDIKSIAIPPLGSGNGGLNWFDVKNVINIQFLPNVPSSVDVYIYEPSKSYNAVPIAEPKLSLSALVLMQIKLSLKKFGAFRLQKGAFLTNLFLYEDYFHFVIGKYGPYDKAIVNISKSIKAFQDFHGLIDTNGAYKLAYNRLVSKKIEIKMQHMMPAIKAATQYANDIEDNKFLECVTTILFLAVNDLKMKSFDDAEIVRLFKDWSQDKAKRFSSNDIMRGIKYLCDTNLLSKDLTNLMFNRCLNHLRN